MCMLDSAAKFRSMSLIPPSIIEFGCTVVAFLIANLYIFTKGTTANIGDEVQRINQRTKQLVSKSGGNRRDSWLPRVGRRVKGDQ